MTASRRQHLFGRSTTAHTPRPSAWGDTLRERRLTRSPLVGTGLSPATWTLYLREMLATGFDVERYFAVDSTDHRIHTQQ
jgi:hypothetical protein